MMKRVAEALFVLVTFIIFAMMLAFMQVVLGMNDVVPR